MSTDDLCPEHMCYACGTCWYESSLICESCKGLDEPVPGAVLVCAWDSNKRRATWKPYAICKPGKCEPGPSEVPCFSETMCYRGGCVDIPQCVKEGGTCVPSFHGCPPNYRREDRLECWPGFICCVPETCREGDTRCKDRWTAQICRNGSWVDEPCPENQVCYDGRCVAKTVCEQKGGVCVPTTQECPENTKESGFGCLPNEKCCMPISFECYEKGGACYPTWQNCPSGTTETSYKCPPDMKCCVPKQPGPGPGPSPPEPCPECPTYKFYGVNIFLLACLAAGVATITSYLIGVE